MHVSCNGRTLNQRLSCSLYLGINTKNKCALVKGLNDYVLHISQGATEH